MQGRSTLMLGSTLFKKFLMKVTSSYRKIHTKENTTNMLTKIVSQVKFAHCKELLHILPVV